MNKVVLITGSSKGLGRATALKFASNNYDIIINYNQSEKDALNLKNKIECIGRKCLCIKADVSKEEEVKNMFDIVQKNFGYINVLINNAGITYESFVDQKNKDTFHKIIDTNLIGPFYCSKYFASILKDAIVNVSSTNAFCGHPMTMEYDASKLALLSLTRNEAIEYAPNIRVNAVIPGWIKTDMSKIDDEELEKTFVEEECKSILLKRYANPEEIANVIYFLGSDESSYINGTAICADGGSI